MKGEVIRSEPQRKRDELTGVEVVRLSPDEGNTNHPYFTASQVDRETTYLLVSSDRTGQNQLYTLRLADGEMVQLTDDADVGSSCLDAAHHVAYYFAGHVLKSIRIDDLAEEELMEIPQGFIPTTARSTSTRTQRSTWQSATWHRSARTTPTITGISLSSATTTSGTAH